MIGRRSYLPLGLRPLLQTGRHAGRRTLMAKATAPLRKQKRVPLAVPALYDRQSQVNGKRTFLSQGTVRDFSDSGICLFTNAPLNKGEQITVFCEDIWSAEKCGTVLWCHTMNLSLFRVGVGLQ